MRLLHEQVECVCGERFVGEKVMQIHKDNECMFRQVSCEFCEETMAALELDSHETQCQDELSIGLENV